MKKTKKILALLLCAILLVGASVAGTVAYLTYVTGPVTNTFTIGNVAIALTETPLNVQTGETASGNDVTEIEDIELVPGRVIYKEPKITVAEGSEDCYIFVKVENGLESVGAINWVASEWVQIEDTTNFWKYVGGDDEGVVSAGKTVQVFPSFTCNDNISEYDADIDGKEIKITAYAIQAEGFADVDEAWSAANFS